MENIEAVVSEEVQAAQAAQEAHEAQAGETLDAVSYVKLNILDENGFYVADHIVGESGDMPQNWTSDLVGNGYWKAQYQGATRNAETGEWTSGHWVETGGPTHQQEVDQAVVTKAYLLSQAAIAIAPLQDAVDLDIATPQEQALLKAWKTYRVLVNRIDVNLAPNIVWPTKPGASA